MSKTHEHEHHRWDDDGGHMGHPERLRHLKRRWVKAAERFCGETFEVGRYEEMLVRYREWRDAH